MTPERKELLSSIALYVVATLWVIGMLLLVWAGWNKL